MSLDATQWAWKQRLKPASLKLVLLALADRADEKHKCYPSTRRLVDDTELDRKTILDSLHKLEAAGVIRDTGARRGRTKSVKVWQLIGVVGRHEETDDEEKIHNINARKQAVPKTVQLTEDEDIPNSGSLETEAAPNSVQLSGPKNGTGSGPKNGTPKRSQKRDIEPISRNLSLNHSPPTPQGAGEGSDDRSHEPKAENPAPEPFNTQFAEDVMALFNRVASSPGNANWCPRKLDPNLVMKIQDLHRRNGMDCRESWREYLDCLQSAPFIQSMSAVTARFVFKDDTVENAAGGVYHKVKPLDRTEEARR